MDNKKKQTENDNDLSSDITRKKPKAIPSDLGSISSDLLHVLGFSSNSKNENGEIDISPSPQTSSDFEILQYSTNLPNSTDPCADLPETNEFKPPKAKVMLKKRSRRYTRVAMIAASVMIFLLVFVFLKPFFTEPKPPGANVVGSYNGKYILIEELKSFITLEQAKESEHSACKTHGYDHTQCDPTEECESHPIDSLEGYQQMVTRLAVEQMIQDWASAQGVTQREDVQHGIKDLLDDASVIQLIDQLHEEQITPESISSWEVQQYYDENKDTYNGKSLADVEDEIRQILISQKDEEFFPQYIEELKQTAGLLVNFDLLKITEPTDEEISVFYTQNLSAYQQADSVEALEIKIIADNAQSTASEAIRKIRSGESFDSVAATYGQNGKADKITFEKGKGEVTLEALIWGMKPGDISDPITNADASVSIIKLVNTSEAAAQPLSDVESDIRIILLQKNMDSEYTLRKDEALFSVHSRRYTLGDFYTEFKEISLEYQAEFSTFDKKQQLVEQLIAKELLLEENGDSSANESGQHDYEELKIQYLSQILHKEEVDGKLGEPTEKEMKQFYKENNDSFIIPAGVQISLIWIDQGLNNENTDQSRQKADEAMALVNSGTDFAEVAKKYSEDGSAKSGGEITEVIYQDYLDGDLGSKVFALQAGETSSIINYLNGYYIIKVRERIEEQQQTYEEVAESIKAHLKEIKHSELEAELEKTMLDNANFTIYDKTLKKILKEQKNG